LRMLKTKAQYTENGTMNARIDDSRAIPIVCYAEDWGRLPSSTQHLMRGLSRTHPILWVDSLGLRAPSASKGDLSRIITKLKRFVSGIKEVEPKIFVLTPIVIPLYKYTLVRWINRLILKFVIKRFLRKQGIADFIQWSSCPSSANMVNALGEKANIYYIGDEFSEFTQFDQGLVGKLERRLLIGADLLLVVSDQLAKTKAQFNPLVIKIPHGCDYAHFAQTQVFAENDIPSDLQNIPNPRIGYYGLIRDWFEFDMLHNIFGSHPEWSLTLIGPSDTDTSKISSLPNVHLLGPKPYTELPKYLRGFDVCIIPYRKTEITINANPLKLLEYLSSGKPVVTTDLPSVYPYRDGLIITSSPAEFEAGIQKALGECESRKCHTRMRLAEANSWQSRVDKIESIFDSHIYPFFEKRQPSKNIQIRNEDYSQKPKPVVMHLIAAMNIAGAEKVVLNLLSQSKICPFDLRVTSFVRGIDGGGTEFLKAAAGCGAKIDRIQTYHRWDFRDVGHLLRIIKRHNVAIIHSHGYKSDISGVIASKLTGVPIIATAHGFTGADANLRFNENLGRFFLRFANTILPVSENIREKLAYSGVPENKINIVPNAVDFDYFRGAPNSDFRKCWGVRRHEILIGSAGRLSVEKAHINLIKALGKLSPDARANLKIVIAGTGPQEQNIRDEADRIGISEKLIFAGFIEDMRSFYQALDIFCLPSLTEGLPLTILEAAASCRAIVASKVGSIGNMIDHSTDGFIVAAGDIEGLSDSLQHLISSPQLRESFGLRLRDKLSRNYDIQPWAHKIFGIYGQFVGH